MPDRYLGVQLGRYRTSRLLGSGSFSWVYEAADVESGALVALKVLRPEYAGQSDAETRFRREAETARRLRHPNIVAVRDVGQSSGAAYVVMDLLPLSLARRLELVHRLPETEVIRIGLDVASALAIAHAAGVVHRDIKPDNILLGDQGEAIVGDFGLARALEGDPSMSASQQVMGTPHYFSPEQARGIPVDGRSDLYSLGVTLFRAATGTLPYEGDDWYTVAKLHIEADIPSARERVPELTPQFDAILQRLLAKKQEDRFSSATMLIDALAQLPTAPERPERRPGSGSAEATIIAPAPMSAAFRRNRRAWTRRLAAASVVAIAAVLFLLNQRPDAIGTSALAPDTSRTVTPPPFGGDTSRPVDSLPLDPFFGTGRQGGTSPRPRDSAPAATPSTRKTRVVVQSSSEATVYVEGKEVVAGAPVDVPAGRNVRITAAFPEEQPECRTALRDSTVNLRQGETRTITLAVRPCGALQIDVIPRDALITLESRVDGTRIQVRADTVRSQTLLLPAGRYALTAIYAGFLEYRDSVVTVTNSQQAKLERIRMVAR